ncbi:MAG: acyltransferase domain-containing protein, partial [Pseudomonadota bacterium]
MHSAHVESLRKPLLASTTWCRPQESRIPIVSTVTGDYLDGSQMDAAYFADNLIAPVRFSTAVERLLADGYRSFVEIGPDALLSHDVADTAADLSRAATVTPTLGGDRFVPECLADTLKHLYEAGVDIAWDRVYPQRERYVTLPAYPWQRKRHWRAIPSTPVVTTGPAQQHAADLLGRRIDRHGAIYELPLRAEQLSFCAEHQRDDTWVVPGAVILMAATRAASTLLGASPLELTDVRFEHKIDLDPQLGTTLRLTLEPNEDHA